MIVPLSILVIFTFSLSCPVVSTKNKHDINDEYTQTKQAIQDSRIFLNLKLLDQIKVNKRSKNPDISHPLEQSNQL